MEPDDLLRSVAQEVGVVLRGKILLVDDDTQDLERTSSSLRQEGFEVRAFASYPEGLSRLGSEHFDLVMMKLGKAASSQDEKFWSVRSRSPAAGLSWIWQAVTIGVVTLMWCTWELSPDQASPFPPLGFARGGKPS